LPYFVENRANHPRPNLDVAWSLSGRFSSTLLDAIEHPEDLFEFADLFFTPSDTPSPSPTPESSPSFTSRAGPLHR
jgi:hypothetical protein